MLQGFFFFLFAGDLAADPKLWTHLSFISVLGKGKNFRRFPAGVSAIYRAFLGNIGRRSVKTRPGPKHFQPFYGCLAIRQVILNNSEELLRRVNLARLWSHPSSLRHMLKSLGKFHNRRAFRSCARLFNSSLITR